MHLKFKIMNNFNNQEALCALEFRELGDCYHLWTPENFEIIFTDAEDFKVGMSIIGIAACLFQDIKLLTFELMSNHLHQTLAGREDRILEMFAQIRRMLSKYFKAQGRSINWDKFEAHLRKLLTPEEVRNAITYNNRNGYVVNPDSTPFTYLWGANRYYYNPDAKALALQKATVMSAREKRNISHIHASDSITGLLAFEGYALPLSFCHIDEGERLFRNASHYFSKISRSIEADAKIAKEIGENIFYTDDDLYSAVCRMAAEKFPKSGVSGQEAGNQNIGRQNSPSLLPAQAKVELARAMRFDYNASDKQIMRMLKLDQQTLTGIFGQK